MKIEQREGDIRHAEIPRPGEKLKLSLLDFKVSVMQLHVRKFRDLEPRGTNNSLARTRTQIYRGKPRYQTFKGEFSLKRNSRYKFC